MRTSLQRFVGSRRPGPEDGQPPAPDERTLLQVLLGSAILGAVAGGVSALLGSDAVASVVFGFLIGVLFLWMDLRARSKAGGPPPPAI